MYILIPNLSKVIPILNRPDITHAISNRVSAITIIEYLLILSLIEGKLEESHMFL